MDSASLFWLDDLQSLIRMQSNGEDLLAPGRPNALDMIDFVGIAQAESSPRAEYVYWPTEMSAKCKFHFHRTFELDIGSDDLLKWAGIPTLRDAHRLGTGTTNLQFLQGDSELAPDHARRFQRTMEIRYSTLWMR
jgi:hypothetical protein